MASWKAIDAVSYRALLAGLSVLTKYVPPREPSPGGGK